MSTSEYRAAHKNEMRLYHAEHYSKHRKEIVAWSAAYRATHVKELREKRIIRNASRPEYVTVVTHYQVIFNPKQKQHKNYIGMPFFEEWNPKKGGSLKVGAEWIIKNIGRRPEGASLHVVDPILGFVPGNLEWTHRKKQNREQLVKIIARQRHEIKRLKRDFLELKQCLEEDKQNVA
jgi:hypothetical protein